jgi:aspartyl protease family protein
MSLNQTFFLSLRIELLSLLIGVLVSGHAMAVVPVEAVALFKDRAVVRTAAGQETLKLGETSKAGVTLLRADTAGAKVRYRGTTYDLSLSARVTSSFAKPKQKSVRINRNEFDQYRMRGAVNGHYFDFIVDTGASVVVLSERHADMMGLDFRAGEKGTVQTAQGLASAYFLVVEDVTLGAISLSDVQATVIEGNFPSDVLLGMSFLGEVRLTDDGGVLTLTAKY